MGILGMGLLGIGRGDNLEPPFHRHFIMDTLTRLKIFTLKILRVTLRF